MGTNGRCPTRESPFHMSRMTHSLLLAFQPNSHLGILVFPVRCSIGVLGHVNMKVFRILGIEVVEAAEELRRLDVVVEHMELGNLEVFADAKPYKDLFVVVKAFKCCVQERKRCGSLGRGLGDEKEVEECANGTNKLRR